MTALRPLFFVLRSMKDNGLGRKEDGEGDGVREGDGGGSTQELH